LSRPCLFFVLFFHLSPLLLYLLSFPTRRSSDLIFIRSNLQKSFFLENIFLQNVRYIAFVLKIVPTQVKIIFPNTPLLPISVTMAFRMATQKNPRPFSGAFCQVCGCS